MDFNKGSYSQYLEEDIQIQDIYKPNNQNNKINKQHVNSQVYSIFKPLPLFNEQEAKKEAYQFYRKFLAAVNSKSNKDDDGEQIQNLNIQINNLGTQNQYSFFCFENQFDNQIRLKKQQKQAQKIDQQYEQNEKIDDFVETYIDNMQVLMSWNQTQSQIFNEAQAFIASNRTRPLTLKIMSKIICKIMMFYQHQLEDLLIPELESQGKLQGSQKQIELLRKVYEAENAKIDKYFPGQRLAILEKALPEGYFRRIAKQKQKKKQKSKKIKND